MTALQLRQLVLRAVGAVPQFARWLEGAGSFALRDPSSLDARVAARLVRTVEPLDRADGAVPRDYYGREECLQDAIVDQGLVRELVGRVATAPSAALLRTLGSAIVAVLRASADADYSQDTLLDQAGELLGRHAKLAGTLAGKLTPADRLELADWLFAVLFEVPGGPAKVHLAEYRDALDEAAWADFRKRVNNVQIADDDVRLVIARRELAVLDRDERRIVDLFGGGLDSASQYLATVKALDRADLAETAVKVAEEGFIHFDSSARATRGVQDYFMPQSERRLADRLAEAAAVSGDPATAAEVRFEILRRQPSRKTFAELRQQADKAGVWSTYAQRAERHLATGAPQEWTRELLDESRVAEAWEFAVSHRAEIRPDVWEAVLAARGATHPAEVLPHYRALVEPRLGAVNRAGYEQVGALLVQMKDFARAAGPVEKAQFAAYMSVLRERARRRPVCREVWHRLGLISTAAP
jgi:hypothetical protein